MTIRGKWGLVYFENSHICHDVSNELHVADIEENYILSLDENILKILLQDKSSGKNIIWATDDYMELGAGYAAGDEIHLQAVTGSHGGVIRPRALKSKEEQGLRTRNMAEVFTPLWICNKMNNLADAAWFANEDVFNTGSGTAWTAREEKVPFSGEKGGRGWLAYLASKRLEITCGEAPYLASRYDTLSGEIVPFTQRIGILDRKLRVINERARNLKDKQKAKKRWLALAKLALQSTYGYEWAGDNVLLARENLLFTVSDYYVEKFAEALPLAALEQFAEIIAWNIWQMDGLKAVVPHSCHDYKKERQPVSPDLFSARDFSVRTLKRSVSPCDVDEDELQKCQGCLKDNIDLHNGIYCSIKNWSTGKILPFKELLEEGSEGEMEKKDFKFDVVIGNPPYQKNTGDKTVQATPLYDKLVMQSMKLNAEYVCMIIPARWYSGGMGLDNFREFMLKNRQISNLIDYPNAKECFPNISLGGGVCYFLWQKNYDGPCKLANISNGKENVMERNLSEYPIFVRYNEAVSIIRKVTKMEESSLLDWVSSLSPFGIGSAERGTEKIVKDDDLKLLSSRGFGYYPRAACTQGKEYIDNWKIAMSKVTSEHAGEPNRDGQFKVISKISILKPGEICTFSYFLVGNSSDEIEILNLKKYLTTKFVRFLLLQSISSINISKDKFRFIPVQDFSHVWTDEMLYKKYELTDEEIGFIESMIKAMD